MTAGVVGSLDQRVARATALDTARIGLEVLAPMLAQGVIVRRPRMLALAEKLDVDRRAGRILQAARDRYGAGVLRLRIPGRSVALVLSTDAKVRDEAAAMLAAVEHVDGHLDWDTFAAGWWRIVRLVGLLAATSANERTCPVGQVPHWLFAFDAAGIAAYRTLALLATHPDPNERARRELAGFDPALPYLRACVLEAVRLWPTAAPTTTGHCSRSAPDRPDVPGGTWSCWLPASWSPR